MSEELAGAWCRLADWAPPEIAVIVLGYTHPGLAELHRALVRRGLFRQAALVKRLSPGLDARPGQTPARAGIGHLGETGHPALFPAGRVPGCALVVVQVLGPGAEPRRGDRQGERWLAARRDLRCPGGYRVPGLGRDCPDPGAVPGRTWPRPGAGSRLCQPLRRVAESGALWQLQCWAAGTGRRPPASDRLFCKARLLNRGLRLPATWFARRYS